MVLHYLCRLFSGRCEPSKPTSTTTADLGQKEAKSEALSKEQLRHMEGGPAAKSTKRKKATSRPR